MESNKNSNFKQISFYSSESDAEIMLAATFYLKSFLKNGNRIKFSIPERIYLSLGEKKFKEIFSDQILELEGSEKSLIEVVVLKTVEFSSTKLLETFKINII